MSTLLLSRQSRRTKELAMLAGEDVETKECVPLRLKDLSTHCHVMGSTQSGKSRYLLGIFQMLAQLPDRPAVIVLDPKQDLFEACRDWALTRDALRARMIAWDPRYEDRFVGFNPLHANGLAVINQCKAVMDALLAAFGQHSIETTTQLAKYLFLALVGARVLEKGLVEVLEILRPDSTMRDEAIEALFARPEFFQIGRSLQSFNDYPRSRREELAASSDARLSRFCHDPKIERILTQKENTLDMRVVMEDGDLLLVNLGKHTAYRPRDAELMGKLLINTIVAAAFARTDRSRHVVVICDEVQDLATHDLADALDQGAGLGMSVLLAHQFPGQFLDGDDPTRKRLWSSIVNDSRAKVCFSMQSASDCELMAETMALDRFDPRRVTEQAMARVVTNQSQSAGVGITEGVLKSSGATVNFSGSLAKGESFAKGKNRSTTKQNSHTDTRSATVSETESDGATLGGSDTLGENVASGVTATEGSSTPLRDDADGTISASTARASQVGSTEAHTDSESITWGTAKTRGNTRGAADTVTESDSEGEQTTDTKNTGHTAGLSFGVNAGTATSRTKSLQYGVSAGESYEPLSRADFVTIVGQRIRSQPLGHFLFRTPFGHSRWMRSPL